MPRFLRRSTTLERLVERGHGVVLRWWVHEVEVEVEEVLDAEVLEEEHDVGEVGALNLGDGGLHEFLAELAVGVESEVESWSSTSCASGALVCVGARDGCYVEAVHSEFGVEDFNFAVSAVDDIFNSIHGVRLVSATFVETIHFLTPLGAASNIFACRSAGSCEYIGSTSNGGESSPNFSIFSASTVHVPSISSCPVIKMSTSPGGLLKCSCIVCLTATMT